MISLRVPRVKSSSKRVGMSREAADKVKSAGNQPDFSCSGKGRLRKILAAGLGNHQNFLIGDVGRRGPLGNEGQLEVVDDVVHDGGVCQESDDLHDAAAVRTGHEVDFVRGGPIGLSFLWRPDEDYLFH